MNQEWWKFFMGAVFIVLGLYFFLSSLKDIMNWSKDEKRDNPAHVRIARMGYVRTFIGGILLILVGIYLTKKYFFI